MKITRRALEAVVAHTRRRMPEECCGILLARDEDPSTVDNVVPAENAEPDRPERAYVLGYRAHIQAVEMEAAGAARIAGYYHSHPRGRAEPSGRDMKDSIEGTTYLIVGVGPEGLECMTWRIDDNQPVPEPLEVTE